MAVTFLQVTSGTFPVQIKKGRHNIPAHLNAFKKQNNGTAHRICAAQTLEPFLGALQFVVALCAFCQKSKEQLSFSQDSR